MTAAQRMERVRERVAKACARGGRRTDEVRVVAVSKTFGPEAVAALAEAGQTVFGESRVQEAVQKVPLCPSRLEWHMVGHLQRNKVKQVVPWCSMVHSVDSARLLQALDAACAQAGKTMPVLLEVNLAGESSKFGLAPAAVPAVLESTGTVVHLDVIGLMTLPPYREDVEAVRPYFRELRQRRDEWSRTIGIGLPELSMGMSHDFEVAIEEGATWIRPGTCLFRERARPKLSNDTRGSEGQ